MTAAPTSAEQPRAQLGLVATGALVVGGIIGTGIFAVPAAVAKFGWMAYPAFAALARDDPRTGGPAYVYAQQAFGPRNSVTSRRSRAGSVQTTAVAIAGSLQMEEVSLRDTSPARNEVSHVFWPIPSQPRGQSRSSTRASEVGD